MRRKPVNLPETFPERIINQGTLFAFVATLFRGRKGLKHGVQRFDKMCARTSALGLGSVGEVREFGWNLRAFALRVEAHADH